jgi:hypothetical protein
MGRIRQMIAVNGRKCWTLFDSGARNTNADIEGHAVSTYALVVDNIGRDEDGKPIEILFGALAMQQWGIKLNRREEKLDPDKLSGRIRRILTAATYNSLDGY